MGKQFVAYPSDMNIKLEKAHQKKEVRVNWTEQEEGPLSGSSKQCFIDLKNMCETDSTGKNVIKINRCIIAEGMLQNDPVIFHKLVLVSIRSGHIISMLFSLCIGDIHMLNDTLFCIARFRGSTSKDMDSNDK